MKGRSIQEALGMEIQTLKAQIVSLQSYLCNEEVFCSLQNSDTVKIKKLEVEIDSKERLKALTKKRAVRKKKIIETRQSLDKELELLLMKKETLEHKINQQTSQRDKDQQTVFKVDSIFDFCLMVLY